VNFVFQNIKHDRLVVAAIDFGTYGSGFALCTRADYKRDRNKIFVHTWNSGTAITNKAPTTVLMKPNGKDYISFGYEAERDFVDLDPEDQKKHYLFRQFKMKLFNNPVSIYTNTHHSEMCNKVTMSFENEQV
jgi:hypothetical protein